MRRGLVARDMSFTGMYSSSLNINQAMKTRRMAQVRTSKANAGDLHYHNSAYNFINFLEESLIPHNKLRFINALIKQRLSSASKVTNYGLHERSSTPNSPDQNYLHGTTSKNA
jgi:hypothetical protein